jgi:hypothetical protein
MKCGAPAPDEETLFCNRCGTAFHHHVPHPKSVRITAHKPDLPVSIKISKKKHAPAVVEPAELWDPVPDEEFAASYYPPPAASTVSPSPKKYAHLPLVADEMVKENARDETIVLPGNTKKYAHLPLVADELKEKQSPRLEIETPYFPGPPKEKAARPRKGLFDLLKK